MLQAQTERSAITVGIVLLGAGVLTVGNGVWTFQHALRFQATAIRASATVVATTNPRGALRFAPEQGIVESTLPRGRHEPVGSTLKILYEPGNPEHWTLEPGYDPDHGVLLAWVGGLIFFVGSFLLTLGWVSRRRNQRPFWQ